MNCQKAGRQTNLGSISFEDANNRRFDTIPVIKMEKGSKLIKGGFTYCFRMGNGCNIHLGVAL